MGGVFPSHIIKTTLPKWTRVLKEVDFFSLFSAFISSRFTRMAKDASIVLREGNISLHF